MFWFKQCPRCSGDLYNSRDCFGPFITCLQCGLNKDVMGLPVDLKELSFEPIPAKLVPQPESGKQRRMSHGGRHHPNSEVFREASTSAA